MIICLFSYILESPWGDKFATRIAFLSQIVFLETTPRLGHSLKSSLYYIFRALTISTIQ